MTMDADPDRPGVELDRKELDADFGATWEIHTLSREGMEPAWLAYHRQRPTMPAVTASSAGELRDFLAVLTPHPRPGG